jgi:hypothetical protein
MPKVNVIMFSEPVQHGLNYESCFMKRLADDIRRVAIVTPVETDGTASANDTALSTHDPAAFYSVGHGQCCIHSVECRTPYIEAAGYHCDIHFQCEHFTYDCTTNLRLDAFAGRHVHLNSCVCGMNLGPELIRHGARSFIGYSSLFVYGVYMEGAAIPGPCEPPKSDADLYSFNDSDTEAERAIALRGASVAEAADALRTKFREYIRRYTEGEWKDWPIAPYAAMFLEHDMDHLVVLGDTAYRPCPGRAPPVRVGIPMMFALPLVLGAVWFGSASEKSIT